MNKKIEEMLFENLPQRIFYKNINSEYIFCNNNYANDLKIKKEEIVGRTDFDLYPEYLAIKYRKDDQRIILSGISEDIEENYIENGHEIIIHTVKTPIKDANGNVEGILGIFWDITEQKKIEDALLESQKRYKNFFENSPIALLEEDFFNVKMHIEQLNLKGIDIKKYFENNPEEITKCISMIKIVDVNNAALELFGASNKNQFLKGLQNIFTDRSYNKFIEEIIAISNGDIVFECDDNPKTFSGHDININLKWCVAPGHEKTYSRVLVSMIDITEKKRSENRLKLLSSAIEVAPNGVQILDLSGKVVYSNKAVEKIFGFSKEEYNVMHQMNIYSEFDSVILPTIKDKGRWTGELNTKHKNGQHIPIWLDASMVRDAKDNPIAIVEIISDITEYNKMRKEIKDRESFLNSIFESIQDGICILDKNLNILRVNPTYKKWHSLDKNTFIGKKCYEIFYRRIEPCKACPSQDVLNSGKSSYKIISRVSGDKKNWIEVHAFPMIDINSRELSGVVEVVTDITKQKDAEDLLRKAHDELEIRVQERTAELENANKILQQQIIQQKNAQEQIREQATLLDNAQDAIIARDLNHKIKYWNKGAERLYGWSSEEVIGKNANTLLYKNVHDIDKSSQLKLTDIEKIVIKEGKWSGELNQTTKDNNEIIVESRWTLMRDIDNNPKMILVINTNITERKRLLAQLLRAQRMESIGTLAGGIAHDLNNVLTPIMLSVELLKEKIGNCDENQKLLGMIEKNTVRGANLIKQVLSFARGIEGEKKAIQMTYILSEIEKIMKETFPKNISIQIYVQKDLWTIFGDATQLHQVVMNLCVNARDAMPYGGTLKISAENFYIDENYVLMDPEAKVGNYIIVSVRDNGIGIPIEIQDRIFEPFFTTKEVGKGTGLGLSTAHAVVKGHGGFIHLYSEVGKGTKFKVYLPAKVDNVQYEEKHSTSMINGHGELILVAEDEESIREITKSTLESHGYKVITAEDGAQALALYAENKQDINIVLMDIMMPLLDGQDSIRAIRRINPDAKIIAASGLMEKDKLSKIADIHIEAFLTKPYTGEKLLKIIANILDNR